MCWCHLACCYKALPLYTAAILFVEFILVIVRIAIFFSPSSQLVTNSQAVAGFILDWISSLAATLLGILVALTILIILLAILAAILAALCSSRNRVHSYNEDSTSNTLKDLWKNKPLQRLIQLNCNCPCYIARPKARFIARLVFLLVCFIFRIIAIALYASAGSNTNGGSLAIVCAISLACLGTIFLIDLYHYGVWWHYRPQCDTRCSLLSKKHKRYIPYHLIGVNRTMRLGDKPCPDGFQCRNRLLEHILIFHSDDFKPQERYSQVQQKNPDDTLYIGFHRTKPEAAVSIAHSDFSISTNPRTTMLGQGVYFARSMAETEGKANSAGAYICAEIQMGRVKNVSPGSDINALRGTRDWWATYDTVYYNHSNDSRDEFCVKSPDQILRWVMVVDPECDEKVRNYGLDTEFDDTKCGCI
ncbi:unnamed protein product [Rotaria socialis]|uniref:PARP catalytic domain-containing protein n=1 Tax=Rotaria socialis TaxID=392032 RepID=A0A820YR49_9BILA|nr:unnamed protein product [Rotaria socialis]CAF4553869.1 unnamed protein product [Rotaria socialis]